MSAKIISSREDSDKLDFDFEHSEGCISGEAKFELINSKKKEKIFTGSGYFLFTYLQSISFVIILKVEI